jgi:nucleoside 2-deoxyribosyltransferase
MAGQAFVETQSKAFDKVAALAKRLDVKDLAPDDRVGRWMIVTGAGQHYDVVDLVMAMLDKIDARLP